MDAVKHEPERCAATPAAGAPLRSYGANSRVFVTVAPAGADLV
jgi:hypothetical protein